MTHCSLEIPEQKQANSKSSVYKELPRQGVFFLSKVSCIHETSCCPFKHQSIPCEKWKVFADSPRAGITEFGFGIKVLFEPLSVICFSLTQSGGNYSSDRDLDQITCNCSSTFFVSSRSISYSVDHPCFGDQVSTSI